MRAGFARIEITPENAMPMAGYDRREDLSKGCLEPLYASALVLGDSTPELAILSLDLLGTDAAFCEDIRKQAGKLHIIHPERIMICATHTHAGPSGIFKNKSDYCRDYVDRLTKSSLKAISDALEDFAEAEAYYFPLRVKGLAAPRNAVSDLLKENHAMRADVIRFSRKDGCILLCTFQCHPTVLDERNLYFSRDLPGACERFLSGSERAIFLNGSCADVSTRYTRKCSNDAELLRLGSLWGRAVKDLQESAGHKLDITVKAYKDSVYLPGRPGMSIQAQASLMSMLKENLHACTDPGERREYLSRLAVLERGEYTSLPGKEISAGLYDLGSLTLLALPLEIDSKLGEECSTMLETKLDKPALIVCYAGGYEGYLPSGKEISANSSYEDLASPYSSRSREELLNLIEKLLNSYNSSEKNPKVKTALMGGMQNEP